MHDAASQPPSPLPASPSKDDSPLTTDDVLQLVDAVTADLERFTQQMALVVEQVVTVESSGGHVTGSGKGGQILSITVDPHWAASARNSEREGGRAEPHAGGSGIYHARVLDFYDHLGSAGLFICRWHGGDFEGVGSLSSPADLRSEDYRVHDAAHFDGGAGGRVLSRCCALSPAVVECASEVQPEITRVRLTRSASIAQLRGRCGTSLGSDDGGARTDVGVKERPVRAAGRRVWRSRPGPCVRWPDGRVASLR
jgi:hypothetical protein